LHQVGLKLACWFCWRFFSSISLCKNCFPNCAISPLRTMILKRNVICTISGSFYVNLSFLAQWFLRKNNPTIFLQLYPLWRGPGPLFVSTWLPIVQG
jgi:hypothetical protein